MGKHKPSTTPTIGGAKESDDWRVRLTDDAGNVSRELEVRGYQYDWKDIKSHYVTPDNPLLRVNGAEIVVLTESAAKKWVITDEIKRFGGKQPLMCTYTAIKDYVEKLHGIRFSYEDEKFFKEHPLVETDGCPMGATLRVAQELIEPYGLRVSRVQLTPGVNPVGDLAQWRRVLGCNPKAMSDRDTSNAVWREETKDDTDYRFEFAERGLRPAVSCGIALASDNYTTGASMGHARYVAPRETPNCPILTFQMERAREVPWKKPPVFAAVANPVKYETYFDANKWWQDKPKSSIASKVTHYFQGKEVKPPTTWIKGGNHEISYLTPVCKTCKRPSDKQRHTLLVPGVCDDCWNMFWANWHCPADACKRTTIVQPIRFRYAKYTKIGGPGTSTAIFGRCTMCHQEVVIEATVDKRVWRMTDAITEALTDLQELRAKGSSDTPPEPVEITAGENGAVD